MAVCFAWAPLNNKEEKTMACRFIGFGSRLVKLAVGAAVLAGAIVWSTPLCAGPAEEAQQILSATGVKGGLVVHLGCGDGRLTAALRANDSYLVHGLDADAANVEKARTHIRSLGLYGPVSVQRWADVACLPYADNFVNLIVISDSGSEIPEAEVIRALAPLGVAYARGKDGKWAKTVKPWPKEIDQWTHFLHGPDQLSSVDGRPAMDAQPRGTLEHQRRRLGLRPHVLDR
jgi:SAM-dependent methyltransferase